MDLKGSCPHRLPLLHTTVSSMPLKRLALESVCVNTTRTEKGEHAGMTQAVLCFLSNHFWDFTVYSSVSLTEQDTSTTIKSQLSIILWDRDQGETNDNCHDRLQRETRVGLRTFLSLTYSSGIIYFSIFWPAAKESLKVRCVGFRCTYWQKWNLI